MPELELPIDTCPLCGLSGILSIPFLGYSRSRQYTCPNCGTFNMTLMAYRFTPIFNNHEIRSKLSYFSRHNSSPEKPILIHKENYESILKLVTLPSTLQQLENLLLWLGEKSSKSLNIINESHHHLPALLGCKNSREVLQLLDVLQSDGYIKAPDNLRTPGLKKSFSVHLIPKGIQKIEELEKQKYSSKNYGEISIEKLLFGKESSSVEIKGSCCLDLNRMLKGDGKKIFDNKIALEGVLKEIVALLNTNGGIIIIGAIEKEKFTIEQVGRIPYQVFEDYYLIGTRIEDENLDIYEQKIRNLIVEHISKELVELITISFHEFNGFTFCKIVINKATHKWYYLNKEKFYVRNGNRSDILNGDDADSYKSRNRRQ